MKKFIYAGMLSFLMFCNNTDSTTVPHDLDNTDVDDSVSPRTIDSPAVAPVTDTAQVRN